MINSTSLAYKSKKFSKHLKKIVKKVEAKKDRAKVQLQKRLVKHHTLKDSINETYRYSKKDVHSYSYMGSLSESQKDKRQKLMTRYRAVIDYGKKLDGYQHDAAMEEFELVTAE